MKRVLVPLLVAVALLSIAAAGYWLTRPPAAVPVACVDPLAGCGFEHRGAKATVRFSTQPAPLEAFQLNVRAPGARRVSAELQMQDMDMGFNRYDLRPAQDGTFSAQVTLPVCISGRRDWLLFVDIDGTRYQLPFSTR